MLVLLEVEGLAQGLEHVEDLVEGNLVEIGEGERTCQGKPLHMGGRVRCLEGDAAAPSAERRPVLLDHLAPQKERDAEVAHDSISFRKFTASS
jgi:hypothetical protein